MRDKEKKKAYDQTYRAAYRAAHREKINANMRVYHATHREELNARNRAYRIVHREEINAQKCTYREGRREQFKAANRAYYTAHQEELQAYARARYVTHREEIKAKNHTYAVAMRLQHRAAVLAHYGGTCACCGETTSEFLAIDHINGGGSRHRKEVIRGSDQAAWLIKHGFPDGFRLLCHNCNMARGYYGYCPHEKQAAIGMATRDLASIQLSVGQI